MFQNTLETFHDITMATETVFKYVLFLNLLQNTYEMFQGLTQG